MRCLSEPDLSRKTITGPALPPVDVYLDFWTSPVAGHDCGRFAASLKQCPGK
jgi:hypothetical protein